VWLCILSRSSRIARNASTRPSACGCAEEAQLGRPTTDRAQRWAMQSSKSPAQRRHKLTLRFTLSWSNIQLRRGAGHSEFTHKTSWADIGGSFWGFGPMYRSHERPIVSTRQCSKQSKANIRHAHVCSGRLGLPCASRAAAQKGERAADAWKSGGPMWRRQSSTKLSEQGPALRERLWEARSAVMMGPAVRLEWSRRVHILWVLSTEGGRGASNPGRACTSPSQRIHGTTRQCKQNQVQGVRGNACAPRVGEGAS